ncbi:BnaA09g43310D [Brassica napus]|nr:BnaA09g43310D [Brassica napus]
MQRPNSSSSSS